MPILWMGNQASERSNFPGIIREENGSAPEELLLE